MFMIPVEYRLVKDNHGIIFLMYKRKTSWYFNNSGFYLFIAVLRGDGYNG